MNAPLMDSWDGQAWIGVFDSFRQVAAEASIFESDIWQNRLTASVSRDHDELTSRLAGYCAPALLQEYQERQSDGYFPHVVDFGGGYGSACFALAEALQMNPSSVASNWLVCEIDAVVSSAQGAVPAVIQRDLPQAVKAHLAQEVDILHCGSVLQYLPEWEQELDWLIRTLRPTSLVVTDALVGDFPSFVTAQQYYGALQPVWFLNEQDLNKAVTSLGYSLKVSEAETAPNTREYLPCRNHPRELQISTARSLVYSRAG